MKLPIVKIPDPILRQKAHPVKKITPELVLLAENMLETMKASNGIGLAAPQIGTSIRLLVTGLETTDDEDEHIPQTTLFNPYITKRSKSKSKRTEGCLSIPGLTGVVERPTAVTVTGLDERGKKVTVAAENLYARVLQHEIDHLNGVLFIDRLVKYRVVFYGTSDFGVPALEKLVNHPQFDVVAVVTETDKAGGRGHKLIQSPVKQRALAHNLPVLQPASLNQTHADSAKSGEARGAIKSIRQLAPDFQIVASYGKILPQGVLDLALQMSINIHPSLLPKYRGATPIQSAILHGETKTGVAIMQMSAEMDAGPILSLYEHKILPAETSSELMDRLSRAAATQLILTLEELMADKGQSWTQNDDDATYTEKIDHDAARIDWSKSAKTIVNHIRAMSAKPGAFTDIDGQDIKILRAHLADGQIDLDEILLPGKKPMTMTDLKNGYKPLHSTLQDLIKRASA